MAKTRQQKEELFKALKDNFDAAKSVVFVHFDKLKVKEIEALRKLFRAERINYVVAKKTLLKKALKESGIANLEEKFFAKEVGVAFGIDDEVAPARVIQKFSKDHEALKAFGGVLEHGFVGADKVIELSKLPSKEELLAKVVGSLNAPISGFVNVLAGNLRGLVQILSAIKDSK